MCAAAAAAGLAGAIGLAVLVGRRDRIRRGLSDAVDRFRRSSAPSVRLYDLGAWMVMRRLYRQLADDLAAPATGAECVVDIGCGPGRLLVELAHRTPTPRLIGIDIDPAMTSAARARLVREGLTDRAQVLVADACSMPLGDGSVDLVTSSFSVHHWAQPGRVVAEIARVLAPGGSVYLYDVPGWFGRLEGIGSIEQVAAAAPFAVKEVGPLAWPARRVSLVTRAVLR